VSEVGVVGVGCVVGSSSSRESGSVRSVCMCNGKKIRKRNWSGSKTYMLV